MDDMGDGMSGEVSLSDLTQITNGLGPVEIFHDDGTDGGVLAALIHMDGSVEICDAAADAEFMRKGRDEVQ